MLTEDKWLKIQTRTRKWFGFQAIAQKPDHFASEQVPMIRNPNTFGIQIVTVIRFENTLRADTRTIEDNFIGKMIR